MIKITNLGTDVEFFLFDTQQKKHVCAIPFVGGASKDNPFPMLNEDESVKEGFLFMHDRASVEFNVPPTTNFEEFKNNLKFAKDYILNMANSNYGKGTIVASEQASVYFPWEELEDPKSVEIGCQPSWNAWANSENDVPNIKNSSLQACGMHYHLELDFQNSDKYYIMLSAIRAMDLFLGVPSVILDHDTERRKIYGSAGSFRNHLDANRFEYRVLSNFILFNDEYLEFMWKQIYKAIDYVNEYEIIEGKLGKDIQDCINNSDIDLAYKILESQKITIPSKIYA